MSDLYFPALLVPSTSRFDLQGNAQRFVSPITGYTRTQGRPGERAKISMQLNKLSGSIRNVAQSLIAKLEAGSGRVYLHDHTYRVRGSFTATELAPSTTFLNGTTGYDSVDHTLTVTDRVLRGTRLSNDGTTAGIVRLNASATVTAYQPYVGRIMVVAGRGDNTNLSIRFGSGSYGADYKNTAGLTPGMLTSAFVPFTSPLHFCVAQQACNAIAGDYVEVPFFSLAPCALVDNGENLLTYSDDFSNAVWTKTNSSVGSSTATSPDGSLTTVQTLKEDSTAGGAHSFECSTTVAPNANLDYCFTLIVRASNRTWVRIMMVETSTSHNVSVFVNLSTGAPNSANASGTGMDNPRCYVTDLGGSWYQCSIIGRKTTNATSMITRIYAGESSGDNVFDGLNQTSLRLFRAAFAQCSAPMRAVMTTGTAITGSTAAQNLGGGIYTTGWPVSTSGLLLRGDQVQIGDQLLIVTQPVNSDSSGCAFLQTYPALRVAPANGDPVICNQPMGKFMLEENESGWSNYPPGFYSDADLVFSDAA